MDPGAWTFQYATPPGLGLSPGSSGGLHHRLIYGVPPGLADEDAVSGGYVFI